MAGADIVASVYGAAPTPGAATAGAAFSLSSLAVARSASKAAHSDSSTAEVVADGGAVLCGAGVAGCTAIDDTDVALDVCEGICRPSVGPREVPEAAPAGPSILTRGDRLLAMMMFGVDVAESERASGVAGLEGIAISTPWIGVLDALLPSSGGLMVLSLAAPVVGVPAPAVFIGGSVFVVPLVSSSVLLRFARMTVEVSSPSAASSIS